MKQVMEIYGKFLLEAAVVVVLLLLFFTGIKDENGNQGVFQIIGARLPLFSPDYGQYIDYISVGTESTKKAPVIRFQSAGVIKKGSYKMSDCIVAVDYAGNTIPINIVNVKSPDGEDMTADCNQETTEIRFMAAGVYTVTVSAKDDVNRKSIKVMEIPVNE